MAPLLVESRCMADRALSAAFARGLEPPPQLAARRVEQEHLVVVAAARNQSAVPASMRERHACSVSSCAPKPSRRLSILSAAMLPRFPSTANSNPINSRPSSGASAGDEPTQSAPVNRHTSAPVCGVEAINVPVIAAKINPAVVERRARPEILVPSGVDREIPPRDPSRAFRHQKIPQSLPK